MSARSKGDNAEREAKKKLEAEGYMVFRPQKVSWYGTQDIWNMFDMVAISKGTDSINPHIKFVQVKSGGTAGFLKRLKAWRETYPIINVSYELWVRMHKKGRIYWKIYV